MLEFAELEKESVFDENSGECMVSIKYDEQNENEIIIRLLAFGPVVEVLSPYDFRRKIKERVDRQLALMKNKQRLSAVYMAESLAFYRLKDLPVKQHHKVKLRHKISVISKLTKHIMFKTAGTVNVPKTLPYKVFDFIVFFFFL